MLCPAWAKAKCSPWDMEARDKAHLEEKQINDKRRCTLSMFPLFYICNFSVGSLPIDILMLMYRVSEYFRLVSIMYQVYCVASLNMKNLISHTPLNCARNAFTLALNDSAEAFVRRLSK